MGERKHSTTLEYHCFGYKACVVHSGWDLTVHGRAPGNWQLRLNHVNVHSFSHLIQLSYSFGVCPVQSISVSGDNFDLSVGECGMCGAGD